MSVGSDYGYSTSTVAQREQAEKKALASGKVTHTDFLKLLTKQLTTQDPLNPMQDLDFTAQLAQLQALDEQMAMTKSVQAMRIDTQIQAGTNMIGKYIAGADDDGNQVSGLVKRVTQSNGSVYAEMTNGQKVGISNVANIWNDANSMINEMANGSSVIGKWVEAGYDEAKQPIRGIVESMDVKNGQITFKLYGGKSISWEQITSMREPTEDELWYTLPDELRAKVEKAQGMTDMGITGTTDDGKKINGIVAQAQLSGSKVYLVLYDGQKIDFDKIEGEVREPTADDAAKSLDGMWVEGLDTEGKDVKGKVVGAEAFSNGIALKLSSGKYIYLDSVTALRKPTEEDLASLLQEQEEAAKETANSEAA